MIIPNVILDKWMPHLEGDELKVVLLIAHRGIRNGSYVKLTRKEISEATGLGGGDAVDEVLRHLYAALLLDINYDLEWKQISCRLNWDWQPDSVGTGCVEDGSGTMLSSPSGSDCTTSPFAALRSLGQGYRND